MKTPHKPSPSMVVALVALVAATSGSAVAASLITSSQIKNGTIQTKDLSKKARKSLKGKTGATGARGATGATGAAGAAGAPGANGTAVGYATVASGGTVSSALNVTTANVTKPAASNGFYCFSGLPFTPKNAQVTLAEPFPSGETLGIAARVVLGTPNAGFSCPAGTQALVTIRKDAGGVEDHGFSILFN